MGFGLPAESVIKRFQEGILTDLENAVTTAIDSGLSE